MGGERFALTRSSPVDPPPVTVPATKAAAGRNPL
jgi:hypothetical protein